MLATWDGMFNWVRRMDIIDYLRIPFTIIRAHQSNSLRDMSQHFSLAIDSVNVLLFKPEYQV